MHEFFEYTKTEGLKPIPNFIPELEEAKSYHEELSAAGFELATTLVVDESYWYRNASADCAYAFLYPTRSVTLAMVTEDDLRHFIEHEDLFSGWILECVNSTARATQYV